ncbi:MAG: hypothetical protein JNK37_06040 [Verrucomicrobiales bacterium]|nr:hypothetical protein [Verrucomicrobiales bacterium]
MSILSALQSRFSSPRWRHIAAQFGIPRFHRFEIVFMRVLYAYVLFQCMPLGEPFSNHGLKIAEAIVPGDSLAAIVGNKESNRMLRPPLPPISDLLPQSEAKIPFDAQPQPDGIAKFVDLTFFHDDRFVEILPWIVLPCLALYISGFGLPVALPILCFVLLGSRTLYNSQGYIHHGFQMVSLILLAQTVVSLWALWKNPREAMGLKPASAMTRHGRTWWDVLIRYSQLMIIASYMIPGVIKQFKSGGQWFLNSHYIGVQVVKTHRQNYYNNLEEEWAPEQMPPLANFMLEHKNWTRLLLGCGVGLQVIAFLALYNRLTWLVFGLMFISFHYLNDIMFGLYFYHVEKLDWIFLVNLPFWAWWLWRRFARKAPVALDAPQALPGGVTAAG